jgi:pilus assembly protein CpaF
VIDRVARGQDLSVLDRDPVVPPELASRLEVVVREQVTAMQRESALSDDCDVEQLQRDVLRELIGLGPFETLLSDDTVVDAYLSNYGRLLAERMGGQIVSVPPSFSGNAAVARAVLRLAHQSGQPKRDGEDIIERRLPGGTQMWAFGPPTASDWAVALRKPKRVELSLAELVRAGALSKSIATFLEACVTAYVNILVVGLGTAPVAGMLSALASAVPAGERIIVLQDAESIGVAQALSIPLTLSDPGAQAPRCIRAASRFGADRLLVASLAGETGAATIDAIGEGTEGVMAGMGAPSLRHALSRLTSHVALSRPGASIDAAREAIAGAFDVLVEVAKPDGRVRVLRVAEVVGTDDRGIASRDLFVYRPDAAGAAGEAAYVVTGTSPRFSADVVARGGRIDPAMFRRK